MDFGALPPEVNSARMYAGPGAGSMIAAAGAWDGLAAELHTTEAGAATMIAALTDMSWEGPASASMTGAVAPYLTWLGAAAVQCEQAAGQARVAAAAFEAAFAMTVPPPVVTANRAQLMALIATNVFGQNTAAIMATEAQYAEMWAQDAAAMYGYAAGSAAATTLTPFTTPPSTTNQTGAGSQTAAVAHDASSSAAGHAQTATSSLSTVTQTLQGLAQPTQTASGLSQVSAGGGAAVGSSGTSGLAGSMSTLSSLAGSTTKSVGNTTGTGASASSGLSGLLGLASGETGPGGLAGYLADAAGLGADGLGLETDAGGLGTDFFGVGLDFLGADSLFQSEGMGSLNGLGGLGVAPGLGPMHLGPLDFGGAASAAGVGQASSVGGLSVPQSWIDASPVSSVSPAGPLPLPSAGSGATQAASSSAVAAPKVTFPTLMERETDGMQRIGMRTNMLPRPLVG